MIVKSPCEQYWFGYMVPKRPRISKKVWYYSVGVMTIKLHIYTLCAAHIHVIHNINCYIDQSPAEPIHMCIPHS